MEDCTPRGKPTPQLNIKEECFGQTHDGRTVTKYTLKNKNGLALDVIDYGATIVAIRLPLRSGPRDVVLGFDRMKDGYLSEKNDFYGGTIGRITNRTKPAKLRLKNECVLLTENLGRNVHFHGGCIGFSKVLWTKEIVNGQFTLRYLSRDMEEGCPGNLDVRATFTVTDEDGVFVKITATTDKTTYVNITNHAYYNLAGHAAGKKAMMDHKLMIESDSYTKTCDSICTGEIIQVTNTPYDFREMKVIGEAMQCLKDVNGFDVNYCLRPPVTCLKLAAKAVYEPDCITMEVYTNSPGLQFYTGNAMKSVCAKERKKYENQGAFCLECQGYPNAANIKSFPSIVLEPKDKYSLDMLLKFQYPGLTC